MNLTKTVKELNKALMEINMLERKLASMPDKAYHQLNPKLSAKLEVLEGRANALLDAVEPHEEAGLCKWFTTPSGSFVTVVKTR